jgi:hypothetical protein
MRTFELPWVRYSCNREVERADRLRFLAVLLVLLSSSPGMFFMLYVLAQRKRSSSRIALEH